MDFEEFFSVDNNLNGKHRATILITSNQIVRAYNGVDGNLDYSIVLNKMLERLDLTKDDVVQVKLYSEKNRRLALFEFPKSITASQFGLVQGFCLENSEVFNNLSQFFNQTIVYYQAENGNNIPCDRLGNVINHAKGLVNSLKPTNSDEVIINKGKHI